MLASLLTIGLSLTLSACEFAQAIGLEPIRLVPLRPNAYFAEGPQRDLAKAIGSGDVAGIEDALARGAQVNAVGNDGATPLLWCMAKARPESMRVLLRNGANPNQVTTRLLAGTEQYESPMHLAAELASDEYLRLLLDSNGDPNLPIGRLARTPLFAAVNASALANTELFLARGADVNYKDRDGYTVLIRPVAVQDFPMATMLLRAGADPTIPTNNGLTAARLVPSEEVLYDFPGNRAAYREFVGEMQRLGYER